MGRVEGWQSIPAGTHMLATEPLRQQDLDELGQAAPRAVSRRVSPFARSRAQSHLRQITHSVRSGLQQSPEPLLRLLRSATSRCKLGVGESKRSRPVSDPVFKLSYETFEPGCHGIKGSATWPISSVLRSRPDTQFPL